MNGTGVPQFPPTATAESSRVGQPVTQERRMPARDERADQIGQQLRRGKRKEFPIVGLGVRGSQHGPHRMPPTLEDGGGELPARSTGSLQAPS